MDCFKKLIKKKTISETDIKESTITDEDIDVLQRKYNVTIPEIYRDFLKTYFFEFDDDTHGRIIIGENAIKNREIYIS